MIPPFIHISIVIPTRAIVAIGFVFKLHRNWWYREVKGSLFESVSLPFVVFVTILVLDEDQIFCKHHDQHHHVWDMSKRVLHMLEANILAGTGCRSSIQMAMDGPSVREVACE